jgi:hypothetical protein
MKFNLELTIEEIQVLDKALSELPFRIAAPLVALINQQIQMQIKKNEGEQ